MSNMIHQEVVINASPSRVYEALTNASQFSAVTGGAPTEISPEVGGTFTLFGGAIHGLHIELVPNQRIVQAWRVGNWPEGVYSIAKFELKEQGDGTLIVFDHIGFPEEHHDHLATGWGDNYWKPLEKFLA
jgi:uncharacterized protein YndB with AHSA1/START domain